MPIPGKPHSLTHFHPYHRNSSEPTPWGETGVPRLYIKTLPKAHPNCVAFPFFCIAEGTQRTFIFELVTVFERVRYLNVRGTFPRAGRVIVHCATDISPRKEYGIALSSCRMACQSSFAREKEAIILHSNINRDVPHDQVRKVVRIRPSLKGQYDVKCSGKKQKQPQS